jgi:hypothetical protein
MNVQNLEPPLAIGTIDQDLPIEAAGPQQSRIISGRLVAATLPSRVLLTRNLAPRWAGHRLHRVRQCVLVWQAQAAGPLIKINATGA